MYGLIYSKELLDPACLTIQSISTTIKPIDSEYLNLSRAQQKITLTVNEDKTVSCDTPFETVWNMDEAELQAALVVECPEKFMGVDTMMRNTVVGLNRLSAQYNGADIHTMQIRFKEFHYWSDYNGQQDRVYVITWTEVKDASGAQGDIIRLEDIRIDGLPVFYATPDEPMYIHCRADSKYWTQVGVSTIKEDIGLGDYALSSEAVRFVGTMEEIPSDVSTYKKGDVISVGGTEYRFYDNAFHLCTAIDLTEVNEKIDALENTDADLTGRIRAIEEDTPGQLTFAGAATGSYDGSSDVTITIPVVDTQAFVPVTRTVNGKALTGNIKLTPADVGAMPANTTIPSVTGLASEEYVDTAIADLINGAPTTLDTLKEIADAMKANKDVVDALEAAVGSKANASALTAHESAKTNPHEVTLTQLGVSASAAELNCVKGVKSEVQSQLDAKVPAARTINGKELSADITLTAADVGALAPTTQIQDTTDIPTFDYVNNTVGSVVTHYYGMSKDYADTKVPMTRTVNAKALDADITLSAGDVGADPAGSASAALTEAKLYTDGIVAATTMNIPSYWIAELQARVNDVREATAAAGWNKSAFLWYHDAHWSYNFQQSPALLKYMYQHTPINKTIFGGDIVDSEGDTSADMAYLWEWRAAIRDLPNHHSVVGNHDDSNEIVDRWSNGYVYNFLLAAEESSDVMRGDEGFYYYIDDYPEKTRYLYLDTASYHGNLEYNAQQQAWLKQALLTTPAGWHIAAVSHIWVKVDYTAWPPVVTGVDSSGKVALDMFDAYNARTGDFSGCTGKVEFCIGGHSHVDADYKSDGGIPIILTECDGRGVRSGLECTQGTISEQSVNAVIADYTNNIVTIVRVGRGNSRIVNLDGSGSTEIPDDNTGGSGDGTGGESGGTTGNYTNLLPLATDKTGSIYNGIGYKNDTRISTSSGADVDKDETGWCSSGYIPVKTNDVVRFANCVFNNTYAIDGTNRQQILYFDKDKNLTGYSFTHDIVEQTTSSVSWNAVLDEDSNIIQVSIPASTANIDVSYMRIVAHEFTSQSIITVNEEIE